MNNNRYYKSFILSISIYLMPILFLYVYQDSIILQSNEQKIININTINFFNNKTNDNKDQSRNFKQTQNVHKTNNKQTKNNNQTKNEANIVSQAQKNEDIKQKTVVPIKYEQNIDLFNETNHNKTSEQKTQLESKLSLNQNQLLKMQENPKPNENIAIIDKMQTIKHNNNNNSKDENLLKQKDFFPQDLSQIKNKFYSELLKKIDSNKFYPLFAKRTGIEGDVEIKFSISQNGTLLNIEVISGHTALKVSAKDAVIKSFPIEIPKQLSGTILNMSIILHYKLI